jgi:hypothetical protein
MDEQTGRQRALYVQLPQRLYELLRDEARQNDRALKGQVVRILRERYAEPRPEPKAGR